MALRISLELPHSVAQNYSMIHNTGSSYKVDVTITRSLESHWTKAEDITEPDFHQVKLQLLCFDICNKMEVRNSAFVTFFSYAIV